MNHSKVAGNGNKPVAQNSVTFTFKYCKVASFLIVTVVQYLVRNDNWRICLDVLNPCGYLGLQRISQFNGIVQQQVYGDVGDRLRCGRRCNMWVK